MATKTARVQVSTDLKEQIIKLARSVWQRIGYDIIEANGGNDVEREEVVEGVVDFMLDECSPVLRKKIDSIPYKERMSIVAEAFPLSSYGL